MTTADAVDPRLLREALGSFATGITIVTTVGGDGEDIGLTANSFNSVSLSPPMVLWSLAKTSHSQPAFASAEYFAVHILAVDQEPLSNLFSKRGADKFGGLNPDRGMAASRCWRIARRGSSVGRRSGTKAAITTSSSARWSISSISTRRR